MSPQGPLDLKEKGGALCFDVSFIDEVFERAPEPALEAVCKTSIIEVLPSFDDLFFILCGDKPFGNSNGFIVCHDISFPFLYSHFYYK